MKLLRLGAPGLEKPAILHADGTYRDLSAIVPELRGLVLTPEGMNRIRAVDPATLPILDARMRIGPCVDRVGKFIGIGLNYSDHASETGADIPAEPIVFMKATSSIIGPNDDVVLPRDALKPDWEVELGVVIGREARYVDEADAMAHVAGYCVVNDVSERHFQIERGGQWDKGKGCDTFGPIGPWLVTPDEIPDPQDLNLWLNVDGHRCQTGSTRTMIFPVKKLVSYVSQFMSLQPGDIIATGTPAGVGLGMKPEPVFLKPGNVMHLGIDGLGEQRQLVQAYGE
jgi:ureidoglycolate lyase